MEGRNMGFQRARYQDLDVYVPYLILLHLKDSMRLLAATRPAASRALYVCFFRWLRPVKVGITLNCMLHAGRYS